MLKSLYLVDYEFHYAVLASRFIDYLNVDGSNEIVDFTKASSEIIKRHLKKLNRWMKLLKLKLHKSLHINGVHLSHLCRSKASRRF